jgi:hypothetical protein
MHSLSREVPMSKLRLALWHIFSKVIMFAACFAFGAFLIFAQADLTVPFVADKYEPVRAVSCQIA